MKTIFRTFGFAAFSSLIASAAAPASAADYIVTPLQDVPYGFKEYYVSGINAAGTVVGSVFRLDSTTAVTWDASGAVTALFPGDSGESSASAINSSGQVLGYYYGPYLWQDGVLSTINIDPAIRFPAPTLLNDFGRVAGTGLFTDGATYQYRAYMVNGGITVDLGTLPGRTTSVATGINNAGDVVGYSYTSASDAHAVLWRSGAIIDLGTLPGQSVSEAYAINDNGRVVGRSGDRLFTWENNVMVDLGSIAAGAVMQPAAINGNGDIVGTARFPANNSATPFLWKNAVFTDLGAVVGTTGCAAVGINDNGHIAIGCAYPDGGYRLTPAAPATDLTIAMAGSPGSLVVGTPFTYTLTVGNGGSQSATNVIVTDALPASVTLVSATASQGSCSGTAVVNCALNTLAGGASVTVQLTVVANVSGQLLNSASVNGAEPENNTFNNTAAVSVYVSSATADLAVSMTASASAVKRLSNLTYTISVYNGGPAGATGVILTDVLPSGMKFVSATASPGVCSGTSTVSCNLGSLANTQHATVSITVQARSRGLFTNTARVSSAVTDGNGVNNSASVTTTVK